MMLSLAFFKSLKLLMHVRPRSGLLSISNFLSFAADEVLIIKSVTHRDFNEMIKVMIQSMVDEVFFFFFLLPSLSWDLPIKGGKLLLIGLIYHTLSVI